MKITAVRNEFNSTLEKNVSTLRAANEKSLADYYKALENAGVSILVKKA